LKDKPIVDGFVNVPIHTFIKAKYMDDIGDGACHYSGAVNDMRRNMDSSYKEVLFT